MAWRRRTSGRGGRRHERLLLIKAGVGPAAEADTEVGRATGHDLPRRHNQSRLPEDRKCLQKGDPAVRRGDRESLTLRLDPDALLFRSKMIGNGRYGGFAPISDV